MRVSMYKFSDFHTEQYLNDYVFYFNIIKLYFQYIITNKFKTIKWLSISFCSLKTH